MLKRIIFLLFSLLLPYFSFAENKLPSGKFKSPPLSAIIQFDDNKQIIISDTERYMENFTSQVSDSILSLQEAWTVIKDDSAKQENYRYAQLFHEWYFTELPILILQKKGMIKTKSGLFRPVRENKFKETGFLFNPKGPVTAERIMSLANHYDYDYFEKLNLFLFALYKNISEEELSKLLKAWRITENIGVYVKDYKGYIDYFFEKFEEDKEKARDIIIRLKLPVTSVLHELVEANRLALFYGILRVPGLNINIQNYLLQTVSHTALTREWKIARNYISALSKHPGVNFNLPDFRGWTPVFQAVDKADDLFFPAVEYLFEQKNRLDVDLLDNKRRTLPLLAAELNKPNLARFLHENEAPFPRQVSLFNSYMTKDYRAIWFKYDSEVNLDPLIFLFNAEDGRPSFETFQKVILAEALSQQRFEKWSYFKYYFLFQLLRGRLSDEENTRYELISSMLFDEKTKPNENHNVKRVIQAIYRGDISAIDKIFSDNLQTRDMLKTPLIGIQHYFEDYWSQKVIREFDLLKRMNVDALPQFGSSLSFHSSTGSLLSEAVRSNQVEVVQYLLKKGADPTFHEGGFVVRDSVVATILMGDILHTHDKHYKDHLRIVQTILDHPSVTERFLKSEVLPGINYVDLAALTGHLPALRGMYKKGMSVSISPIWNTEISVETFSYMSGFLLQTQFILKEQLKRDPDNKEIREDLRICQRAFH